MDESNNTSALSQLVKQHATRHRASDSLRAAISTKILLTTAGQRPAKPRFAWLSELFIGQWTSRGLSFSLGVALTLVVPLLYHQLVMQRMETQQLVALHVDALRTGSLIQITSSDQHTVKPWFQGKLDYAPRVLDLAQQGFPLVGGRVQKINGADLAVLVYARDKHVIELIVRPSQSTMSARFELTRGFSTAQWSDGAMQYAAVSDVELAELQRFAKGFEL